MNDNKKIFEVNENESMDCSYLSSTVQLRPVAVEHCCQTSAVHHQTWPRLELLCKQVNWYQLKTLSKKI